MTTPRAWDSVPDALRIWSGGAGAEEAGAAAAEEVADGAADGKAHGFGQFVGAGAVAPGQGFSWPMRRQLMGAGPTGFPGV